MRTFVCLNLYLLVLAFFIPRSMINYLQFVFIYLFAATVEQVTVLENISDDTKVFLQIHKRIWPSTQRDSLFWSHKRHVPDPQDPDAQKIWIVCNHSTEHVNAPVY